MRALMTGTGFSRRSLPSALLAAALAVCLCGCQTGPEGVMVDLSAVARAYREGADPAPDRAQVERLIEQLPAEQLTDLGVMYEREQRLDDAVWAYQRAVWRDPRYLRAYVNLGNALRQRGEFDEARLRYRQAIALDPDCVEAVNNFGDLAARDGKHVEEAILLLVPLVEEAGRWRSHLLDTLGWLHHQRGDHELARQTLSRALSEASPQDRELRAFVLRRLAAVCRAQGLLQEADRHEAEARLEAADADPAGS